MHVQESIIHVRLLSWYNKFEKSKALKKYVSKELMAVAWHVTRWWNWSLSEDEQKEIELIFTDENCDKAGKW